LETKLIHFLETLKKQRWDDHRYYHHSRINQSLHLVSAVSFLTAYVLLFIDPIAASLLAWLVAMTTRQSGHFFFEPKGYDEVNKATHEYKEQIKVGYNLNRKVVLLSIWAAIPLLVWANPVWLQKFVALNTFTNTDGFIRQTGLLWLWLGVGGVLFRTFHLFFIHNVEAAFAWMTKIMTDPFHDAKIYATSPLYLLKGQLIDPMDHGNYEEEPLPQ
jgi:hypothetical protein